MKTLFRWCMLALVTVALAGAAHLAFLSWQARTLARDRRGLGQSASPSGLSPWTVPGLASAMIPSLIPSLILQSEQRAPSGVASSSDHTKRKRGATYVVVNVGPERSEVLIDGVPRGKTPYVGEVECRRGGKIVVTVHPRVRAPRTFERVCDRDEILIADEQGD